jgi:CBS domain-containing protein
MTIGRICFRRMATVHPETTVEEGARIMARLGISTLVALDPEGNPLGVVSDRDMVVRCLAEGQRPADTLLADIMTSPVPAGLELPAELLGLRGNGSGPEDYQIVESAEYETLPSVQALDDALHMVDREMERRGGRSRDRPSSGKGQP